MLRLSIALACLLLVGCDSLWNSVNRSGLETDMREILKAAAVVPSHLDCTMVGSTRDGSCSLRMSPSEVESVIRALALENISPSSETPSPLARLVARGDPGCVVGDSAPLEAFGIAGRPPVLRLPSGSAFEYLILTFSTSTGQACVHVSYAYG